ncbi:MAG: hypothetical protein PHG03_03715 [Bacilli bacterium]|nr:hypothetical protein [Bacilli bacterium]
MSTIYYKVDLYSCIRYNYRYKSDDLNLEKRQNLTFENVILKNRRTYES